ncbi:hypothetical protein L596_025640 [Steinernema carpocapsae]|uniref:Uncharacterized protein n=1 Tax=Steinernema carpocapsae TaxID=34508 RepID=A0A4U5M8C8_STECR|nr:hypothetical protein L596_025640 [Steinernema carpocapsae]
MCVEAYRVCQASLTCASVSGPSALKSPSAMRLKPFLAALLYVLFAAHASNASGVFDGCPRFRDHYVAVYVAGRVHKFWFSGNASQPINLFEEFFDLYKSSPRPEFHKRAHLLLGYDNDILAVRFEVPDVWDKNVAYLPAVPENVSIIQIDLHEESGINIPLKTYKEGVVVPHDTITFFNDVLYFGNKSISTLDPSEPGYNDHLEHVPGRVYDITHDFGFEQPVWLDPKEKLIGVLEGNRIYRIEMKPRDKIRKIGNTYTHYREHARIKSNDGVTTDVFPKKMSFDNIRGGYYEEYCSYYAFKINSCLIAFGPKHLFHHIVVVPDVAAWRTDVRYVEADSLYMWK